MTFARRFCKVKTLPKTRILHFKRKKRLQKGSVGIATAGGAGLNKKVKRLPEKIVFPF